MCDTYKRSIAATTSHQDVTEIDITFYLNAEDKSYQFKFLNKSNDTVLILEPSINSRFSYFQLMDSEKNKISRRCATINRVQEFSWIELVPNQVLVKNSGISLKSFFCDIDGSELLGFMYQSMVKKKNKVFTGLLSLEIQPTKISDVNTIVFKNNFLIDSIIFVYTKHETKKGDSSEHFLLLITGATK